MPRIDVCLDYVVQEGFVGFILRVGEPILCETVSGFEPMNDYLVTPEDVFEFYDGCAPDFVKKEVEETGAAQFAFAYAGYGVFRVCAFKTGPLLALKFHFTPNECPHHTAFTTHFDLEAKPGSLVLITGPLRSGRTTSITDVLRYRSQQKPESTLLISDDREYFVSSIVSEVVNGSPAALRRFAKAATAQRFQTVGIDCADSVTAVERALHLVENGAEVFLTLAVPEARMVVPYLVASLAQSRGCSPQVSLLALRYHLSALSFQILLPGKKTKTGKKKRSIVAAHEWKLFQERDWNAFADGKSLVEAYEPTMSIGKSIERLRKSGELDEGFSCLLPDEDMIIEG